MRHLFSIDKSLVDVDGNMKPGDIVEILDSTMGTKLATGVRGIIIKKIYTTHGAGVIGWEVLVSGKVREIQQLNLRKLNKSL